MTDHTLGDAPIEEQHYAQMNAIAEALDETFNPGLRHPNKKTGFVLLVFPFDGPGAGDGRANFISNGANRHDVVVLFREMIARFEGMPGVSGNACTKARLSDGTMLLGLSNKNIDNLRLGMPIVFDAKEFGYAGQILIVWGETEEAILKELMLAADTGVAQ